MARLTYCCQFKAVLITRDYTLTAGAALLDIHPATLQRWRASLRQDDLPICDCCKDANRELLRKLRQSGQLKAAFSYSSDRRVPS